MHQGQNSVFILKVQKQKSEVIKLKVRREKNSKDTRILCFSWWLFDDIFLCLSGTLKMNFEEFLVA